MWSEALNVPDRVETEPLGNAFGDQVDNPRHRLIQTTPQRRNFTVGLGQLTLQWIGRCLLWTTVTWLQCTQCACRARPTPIGQCRGIKALPT